MGRALFTLAHRAMAGHDERRLRHHRRRTGLRTAVGWNFGGHLHNEQLVAAMQQVRLPTGEVPGWCCSTLAIHQQTQGTGW